MKKWYMRAIIGPSEGDCVLIILFQLYGSKTWLFDSGWASMTPPPTLEEEYWNIEEEE